MIYVIARNNSGRPTLQHRLVDGTSGFTLCGLEMYNWSRGFQKKPIEQVLCKRCAKL
jgi:hypothetical protein